MDHTGLVHQFAGCSGYTGNQEEPVTDNSPLLGGKMTNYEGGLRIPFLVRGPGVEPGSICETPVNLIDLYPTFMEMAGLDDDPALKLDGCSILPQILGKSDVVLRPDGSAREAIFWFYPMESHMAVTMRKGGWKLVNNLGVGFRGAFGAELFRVRNSDGTVGDLGETNDLAAEYPDVREAMLAELDDFLKGSGVMMPYRNAGHPSVTDQERAAIPVVLELGSNEDRVWVTLESGKDKASIVEAHLLYTMNPKPFDTTGGHREEWLPALATPGEGRVEAMMPPGATHAAFAMRDSNGFLVMSEQLPDYQEAGYSVLNNSEMLKDGYAYKPGLYALIKLGERALRSASRETRSLAQALEAARQTLSDPGAGESAFADAVRVLRSAIRSQGDAPESRDPLLVRFQFDPAF